MRARAVESGEQSPRALVVALALLALTGCSGATLFDDQTGQSGQGKDRLELTWCESAEEGADRYLCGLVLDVGRDKDGIAVNLEHPSGLKATYGADKASGAEQARIRGEVERRLGEVQGGITPSIVRGIVDAAIGL